LTIPVDPVESCNLVERSQKTGAKTPLKTAFSDENFQSACETQDTCIIVFRKMRSMGQPFASRRVVGAVKSENETVKSENTAVGLENATVKSQNAAVDSRPTIFAAIFGLREKVGM